MNALAYLAMYGWVPLILYLFSRYQPHRVVMWMYSLAYLFLPLAALTLIPGLPTYEKITATTYGILFGVLLFDSERFSKFQFSWVDTPMLVWCLCPFFSNFTNDLGLPDALKGVLHQTIIWGMPYFFARLYLNSFDRLRQLSTVILSAALIYVPFVLAETKIGPLLHLRTYGFTVFFDWNQAIRYGGYRPIVFTPHGLSISIWMTSATLIAIWFWQAKVMKKLWKFSIGQVAIIMIVTVILMRSTGAWLVLAMGVASMSVAKWLKTGILIFALIALMATYLSSASTGNFKGDQVLSVTEQATNEDRAGSLKFRFMNEELLGEKARQKMMFGWGWNGRNRIVDAYGKDVAVTDSFWIIVFGTNGIVGLISFWSAMLLPGVAFLQRYPARLWRHPKVAPGAVLVAVLTIYMFDCLSNAFPNQVYTLAAGGLASVASQEMTK